MGNSLCSPVTPGAKPSGTLSDALALLQKSSRPSKRWEELAPTIGAWYADVESILKTMQDRGFGAEGADMGKVTRTAKVCMGTIKGVHYWVKEINGTFNQGTDGPMISKASALRLERVLKPHLQLLRDNRDECLQNPSTFFTYTMMSLRPALKETMRWVDASFKTYDDEVYAEMQSSKETFSRAGSIPKWQAPEYLSRPIALYCDGHHVGAIDPQVYSSKLTHGDRH